MLECCYWRARYHEERQAFVVEAAGWRDGQPVIEYRFGWFEDDETGERQGGLEKWWLEAEGVPAIEFYPFSLAPDKNAFQTEVQQLREAAHQHAKANNLDAFLALIDLVKEQAVAVGLDDDSVFELEGLFGLGAEDAYTQRPFVDENRLHDHVERRQDECWRLQVAQVVDPAANALGWGVFALRYPGLTSAATETEIEAAPQAELLDLDHWSAELSAPKVSINCMASRRVASS